MPAAEESAESPVVSPGVAVQTSADASVANEMPSDDDLKPGEPLASGFDLFTHDECEQGSNCVL